MVLIFDDSDCFSLMINDTLLKMKLLRGLDSREVSTSSLFFPPRGGNSNPPKNKVGNNI